MRSARIRAAASVAAVALVLLACLAATASAAPPFRTGIYVDRPLTPGEAALTSKRIAAAGATLVRFTISWRDIAPASVPAQWDPTNPADPNYRWGDIDMKVQQATAKGLTPLVTILSAPAWAQIGEVAADSSSYRPHPAKLAQFATAAARRFSGKFKGLPHIRYWQVWNEPNITSYLQPLTEKNRDVAPYWYRRMVNAFADAVHAAAPGNLVVAGGLSPFTVNYRTVKSIGPLRFMRELLCMSGVQHPHPTCRTRVKFDIWAHHPYTSGNAFHHAARPDDVSLADLPKMRTLLRAASRAGHVVSRGRVGFWVTEFSWDSKPPDPLAVPTQLLARWVSEALYQMWRSGVSTMIWLQLRDEPYPGSPLQSGLYYRGATMSRDRPKPALTAFRFPFVAYLRSDGVRLWGRTPANVAGKVTIESGAGRFGPWRPVATLSTDRYGLFTKTLHIPASSKTWLRARLAGSPARSLAFSLTQPPDRQINAFG